MYFSDHYLGLLVALDILYRLKRVGQGTSDRAGIEEAKDRERPVRQDR